MNHSIVWPLWTSRAVVVLLTAFVSTLGYLVFFEPSWLSYTNSPFPVLNSPVQAGTAVQLQVDRCSTATISRVYGLSRTLYSERSEILLPAGVTSIDPGCKPVVSASNIIPAGTPPGTYRLRGYAEIQGVVRTNSVEWESQPFEIVP